MAKAPVLTPQDPPADWAPKKNDSPEISLERARGYMRLIRAANRRLTRLTAPIFTRIGLTSTQYLILLRVKNNDGIGQRELSEQLDLDANTISDVVRRLQSMRLLKRERHLVDNRIYTLHVTAAGSALVKKVRGRIDLLSNEALALLPAGHEAAIAEWLIKVGSLENKL